MLPAGGIRVYYGSFTRCAMQRLYQSVVLLQHVGGRLTLGAHAAAGYAKALDGIREIAFDPFESITRSPRRLRSRRERQ